MNNSIDSITENYMGKHYEYNKDILSTLMCITNVTYSKELFQN